MAALCGGECEVFKECEKRKISQKGKYVYVRFLLSYGHNEIRSTVMASLTDIAAVLKRFRLL